MFNEYSLEALLNRGSKGKSDHRTIQIISITVIIFTCLQSLAANPGLQRMKYNNPDLVVDLGVGLWAWPLPMDYDEDGDFDLLVSCPDVPYNGIYFFENSTAGEKMPVFKPGVRIARGMSNIQPSYINGRVRLLLPAQEIIDFKKTEFEKTLDIYPVEKFHDGRIRANQWKYCDFDGDDDLDLIVGIGDWSDYGWDNAFDSLGQWNRGPLHGYVYIIHNEGTDLKPKYAEPVMLTAAGKPVDVFGMPSPNLEDFDGDGDFDLICGEFLDRFTYFENIGTRKEPVFNEGKILMHEKLPLTMDLQMIVPIAIDWDKDGDVDLVVGQEDGRVAFVENLGTVKNGLPLFTEPEFFRQRAAEVKFGALVTPFSCDWDGDGDEDLICGNTAGYIGFIENLDGGNPPRWAVPVYLQADGEIIRIQAGHNGSIQGPCEAKWGYTTLNVADWDHDGLQDIIVNSIWGAVIWFKNIGSKERPKLASPRPILIEWGDGVEKPEWNWWQPSGNQFVSQWRTTPVVLDWNGDGLNDLIMLDHEGYLAFYRRNKKNSRLYLTAGERIFLSKPNSVFDSKHRIKNSVGGLLQLNGGYAGKSGRRKFCFTDWDLDGKFDLLVNSVNINFLKGETTKDGQYVFHDMGEVDQRTLAGHTTSPTIIDWDKNGIPDLLLGAEDGFLYYMSNPYSIEKPRY